LGQFDTDILRGNFTKTGFDEKGDSKTKQPETLAMYLYALKSAVTGGKCQKRLERLFGF
jgi:hypothetical protein